MGDKSKNEDQKMGAEILFLKGFQGFMFAFVLILIEGKIQEVSNGKN